jgi:flagellar FliJ protein
MMQQYMFYRLRLDNNKELLLKETALAELKVEEAREEYIETSKERKIFDKLKDKRQIEYRKVAEIEETKILDDVSAVARKEA